MGWLHFPEKEEALYYHFFVALVSPVRYRFSEETHMALKVTRRQQEGIAVLELKGRLTFGPEDIMLNDEIRRALATRSFRLVIDLGGVDKIDSAGLGTLLYARAELRRAGGGLALANLNPAHMQALLVARLETVFDVYGSALDAINAFFPERKVPHYDLLALVTSMREARLHDMTRAS
jgi:anti-sigma B factor antagonist